MSAVDRESYDELYRSTQSVWSGRPNRQLVVEAADLPPGTALDAGSGEGGDALWLAERGWRVTAVDFSPVALERAAAVARARGSRTGSSGGTRTWMSGRRRQAASTW